MFLNVVEILEERGTTQYRKDMTFVVPRQVKFEGGRGTGEGVGAGLVYGDMGVTITMVGLTGWLVCAKQLCVLGCVCVCVYACMSVCLCVRTSV